MYDDKGYHQIGGSSELIVCDGQFRSRVIQALYTERTQPS